MWLQARGSIEDTKKRISESERRIDEKLPQFVSKKYWYESYPALTNLIREGQQWGIAITNGKP